MGLYPSGAIKSASQRSARSRRLFGVRQLAAALVSSVARKALRVKAQAKLSKLAHSKGFARLRDGILHGWLALLIEPVSTGGSAAFRLRTTCT